MELNTYVYLMTFLENNKYCYSVNMIVFLRLKIY